MCKGKLFKYSWLIVLSCFIFFNQNLYSTSLVNPNDRSRFQIQISSILNQTGPKVNVLDCGAKGNGIEDDTAAIQKAINQAKDGTVVFPKGTYLISSTIVITESGLSLVGDNTTILFKKTTSNSFKLRQIKDGNVIKSGIADSVFLIKGDLDSVSSDIADNIPFESTTFSTLNQNEQLAKGDIVIIASPSYGKEISRQKEILNLNRELNMISEIIENSDNQIKLNDPILISFKNAKVFKMLPIRNVTVKGLNIEIDQSSTEEDISGITMAYAVNTIVENVKIKNTSVSGIDLLHCYLCKISGNQITDSTKLDSANGLGISLNRSHYCLIQNNMLNNHRHGIILDHGNSNCLVENNNVTNIKTTASIDLHGEYNYYNVIRANIISEGKTGIVVGGGGDVHYNDGPFNCIVDNVISDCNVGIEIKNETESTIIGNNKIAATIKKKQLLTNLDATQIINLN